ncbi:MAG: HAD hydrolase-like protein [Clostridia bacterium]|nr:HAD hydrolase-like protein [Clostridia bacterium]
MKKDLYLDFDSTIVNSDKAICRIYNETYKDDPEFVKAEWRKHRNWSYKYVCPLIHKYNDNPVHVIQEYYGSEIFFEYLEFYEGAKEVISELKEHYKLIICTSAFPKNASRKVLWIEEHLPEVDEIIILIDKSGYGYGKERVAMMEDHSIFIDDHPKNLKSTKASKKYLFKFKETDYNGDWSGEIVDSWQKIKEVLLS